MEQKYDVFFGGTLRGIPCKRKGKEKCIDLHIEHAILAVVAAPHSVYVQVINGTVKLVIQGSHMVSGTDALLEVIK